MRGIGGAVLYVKVRTENLFWGKGSGMQILNVPISELKEDPNNARVHDAKNLESLAFSLGKFGQQKPIVIGADKVVIAGNGTLEAAKNLGWKEIAVVVSDLSGKDAIAFAIADNRTAELAAWDMDVLRFQIQEITDVEDGFLESLAFDDQVWKELSAYEPVLEPEIEESGSQVVPQEQPYAPVVTPSIATPNVTQEQTQQTPGIDPMIKEKQRVREVTCPHCGAGFEVSM